ncbi:exonuclease SbcCD subunit D [Tomitella biformata]|uniref:exonuclease SbcCD subunit D n=1 Tax=Tomitella biformata TaxID=630403 RepID=UPI000466C2EF|nr:exonuclease SbcCD subunit D [Tomitella biformata]
MRILHTSDWHIGRTFHGVDLQMDQVRVLAEIAALVESEQVDVVVIAGDVYDRSVPSADAVRACNSALVAIRDAGAIIVATSGNHDSPARLGAGADFAAAGGLHLFTTVAGIAEPVQLADQHGSVLFYGIPYLEPDVCRREMGVPGARTHADVLTAAMERIRQHAAAQEPGVRSVVLAHAFVVGGESTGSERSISVGGVETVAAGVFSGVDYVALGHLHSPQVIDHPVRYSGSPLPYSFGERTHRKGVWIVDLAADGLADVRLVELTPVRGLSQLTGTLPELLADPIHESIEADYISAVLTDDVRPVDAMRKLQERFPHAVRVEWERPGGNPELRYRDRVRGRTDSEVVSSFLADVRSEATADELKLVEDALSASMAETRG